MKVPAVIGCFQIRVPFSAYAGCVLACLCLGANAIGADSTSPKLEDIPSIQYTEVFQYSVSARDPFVDASVVQTLLSQKGQASDGANKELDLDGYKEEFNNLLAEFYSVRGVVCSESGGSALVGRRILRRGDPVDIFLGEGLLKRLEQSNRVYNLGLEEVLHTAVIQARVARVEPTAVVVEMPGMKSMLEIPFHKDQQPGASENGKSTPQKRK